jgi:eukaryotic-like serine/threonine-protein kinase
VSESLSFDSALPLSAEREIDRVSDRFDRQWRQGGPRPRLEDFLGPTPEPTRSRLLRELLLIELEYRRGEGPTPQEYRERLPGYDTEIDAAFAAVSAPNAPSTVDEGPPAGVPAEGEPPPLPEGTGAWAAGPRLELSDEDEPLALPARAGRYLVEGVIARGGMGVVLWAQDPGLNRPLAVKVLRRSLQGQPDLARRFLEEAQVTGQLQHPGIPPVYEVGTLEGGQPFFAMKLIRGTTLAELLQQRREPAEGLPYFLAIFEHVCQAVAYAHSRGIVHRDLKPANVMVGAFGEVQVMDWGLAKVLGGGEPAGSAEVSIIATVRTEAEEQTEAGRVLGTYAYMAPEQARGEVDGLDERADVFGLGAILCVLLTGQPPYLGPTRDEVWRQAKAGDLAGALARLEASGADAELVGLARGCLAPEREARPRDAGTVAEAVAGYQARVQERLWATELERTAAEARAAEARAKALAERRARRFQLGLAAAVLLLVAGAGLAGLWYQHDRTARAQEQARRLGQLSGEVSAALSEAGTLRQEALKRSDNPAQWEATLHRARSALARARALLGQVAGLEELRRQVDEMEEALRADERDRKLVQVQATFFSFAVFFLVGSAWRRCSSCLQP